MRSLPHLVANTPSTQTSPSGVRRFPADVPSVSSSDSGAWRLPPFNHLMTLPARFLATRLGSNSSGDSSPSSTGSGAVSVGNQLPPSARGVTFGSTLDNLLNDSDDEWPPAHGLFQDVFSTGPGGPRQPPEEIDLTVSDDDDDVQGQGQQQEAGSSDDVVEIVEVTDGATQPTPLRRKRRRPPPPSAGATVAVTKRQRMTDMMRSADSTNISLLNNEAVEEFKKKLKCSICLDVLENMTSTLCGHIFCAGCIHQAIRANGKCPLCQRRLHPNDTHRLYF